MVQASSARLQRQISQAGFIPLNWKHLNKLLHKFRTWLHYIYWRNNTASNVIFPLEAYLNRWIKRGFLTPNSRCKMQVRWENPRRYYGCAPSKQFSIVPHLLLCAKRDFPKNEILHSRSSGTQNWFVIPEIALLLQFLYTSSWVVTHMFMISPARQLIRLGPEYPND